MSYRVSHDLDSYGYSQFIQQFQVDLALLYKCEQLFITMNIRFCQQETKRLLLGSELVRMSELYICEAFTELILSLWQPSSKHVCSQVWFTASKKLTKMQSKPYRFSCLSKLGLYQTLAPARYYFIVTHTLRVVCSRIYTCKQPLSYRHWRRC